MEEGIKETVTSSGGGTPDMDHTPQWPLEDVLAKLRGYDLDEVVGERRMGQAMSFDNAEPALRDITATVADLRSDWSDIGPTRQNEVIGHATEFVNVIDNVLKMTSSAVDPTTGASYTAEEVRQQRDAWWNSIKGFHTWFLDDVRPFCVTARARRAAEAVVREESTALSEGEVEKLRQTFMELREQAEEFKELRPVVEAQRTLLGEAGTTDMSHHFEHEAEGHASAWKLWLGLLLGWVIVAGVFGFFIIQWTKPAKDATNAQVASHIFLDLLVIGLLLFIIRILTLQFRAHRHMEVVARNKANALSTFTLLVVGMEPEVRAAVASALAQSVFSSDDAIFADRATEHVTILERVLSPGIDRMKS